MDNITLDKLHKILLILADEIDRICKIYNIKYTLIGGSMLGAVRHKGFIPWDDDMDIAMKRSEYNRFLIACEKELGSDYQMLTNDNNPEYIYGFSKLLLKGTSLVEDGLEDVKYPQAIFVDIFCFDNIPDDLKHRKRQRNKNYFLKKVLRQTQGIKDSPEWNLSTKIIFKFLSLISHLKSRESWIKELNDNMILYNQETTKFVSNMAGFWGYDKETIPAYSLDSISYIQFEDREYMICDNYDEILKSYYGDYMKLPPVEKRRTHGFKELDFGKY